MEVIEKPARESTCLGFEQRRVAAGNQVPKLPGLDRASLVRGSKSLERDTQEMRKAAGRPSATCIK